MYMHLVKRRQVLARNLDAEDGKSPPRYLGDNPLRASAFGRVLGVPHPAVDRRLRINDQLLAPQRRRLQVCVWVREDGDVSVYVEHVETAVRQEAAGNGVARRPQLL